MIARREEPRSFALLKNFLFLIILFILSLLFFSLVRNNSFWHQTDYIYLGNAVRTEASWRVIFESSPILTFQPLVNILFHLEYHWFGMNAWGYYLLNICVHAMNSFLVYLIVFTLLKDRAIAVISSLLFVFAVGNYGKAVMVVSGISDLTITLLTLLTLYFYFLSELKTRGRFNTIWFSTSLFFFLLSLMTKATSFSILGCMLAFNILFQLETGKKAFHRNFLVIATFAIIVLAVKIIFLPLPGKSNMVFFNIFFFRNFGSYLVRMVFPIHGSKLVVHAGPAVQFIYNLATEIRIVTFLCILSYSIFGFIFGNRAIRFFIAWTYITVLPFCFFRFPDDWLNIRYLYLVSVGFNMILASGAVLSSRLLQKRAWRRLIPYAVPLVFVGLSYFIITHLDRNYELLAKSSKIQKIRSDFLKEASLYNKDRSN